MAFNSYKVSTLVLGLALSLASAGSVASAQTSEELMNQAKAAYAAREYSAVGAAKSQEAADLYAQAAKSATDKKTQHLALVGQSEALYFVGAANTAAEVKIEKHLAGLEIADIVVKAYGVTDVTNVPAADLARLKALPADELALVGEALYFRGINLGQWGNANGVMESLGRWPELRSTMEVIVNLGVFGSHEYGAYRVLGRGYFKVPGLFGGSNKQAEKYLSAALKYTLAPGQVFSTNGYNNLYIAELYKDIGKEKEAKEILEAFVAADAKVLNPPSYVEFLEAQKEAQVMLNDM
ncbi:MAG: hypothetical protein U1E10_04530 [Bdellovibrionales bacterium]|nr:hypothetical protein [Bdellovibrionales bacterium]